MQIMQGEYEAESDPTLMLTRAWRMYRVPIILGSVSIIFIVFSLTILVKSTQTSTPITFSSEQTATVAGVRADGGALVVDVSGAVKAPGVYTLPPGSRVEDAVALAGGFSEEADMDRIAQTVNRAAKLSDGAKLYIPQQNDKTSHNISSTGFSNLSDYPNSVSVNTSSQQELEALDGIGPATAKKIISGRPYTSLEELVVKKAIGRALYDRLKSALTL
jgi:competence protein ComEA